MNIFTNVKIYKISVLVITFAITSVASYIGWRDWPLIITCIFAIYMFSGLELFFWKSKVKEYFSAGLFFGILCGSSVYFLLN